MPTLNPFELEQEQKRVRSLLKTDEGKVALRSVLLNSDEWSRFVHSQEREDKKPTVAILIPTHKKPENETGTALERLIPASREAAHIVMRPCVASSVVHWVRNQLLTMLYKDGMHFDYVLMMDDDMVPPPEALITLLERKVDIVGAVCTVRQDPPLPNVRIFSPDGVTAMTADIEGPGVYKVDGVGTGFMLVSKKALDAIGEYYLSARFEREQLHVPKEIADETERKRREAVKRTGDQWWFEFLKHPNGDGEYGEDISFCFKAKACGFDVYADATIEVKHIGNYGYGISDFWAYRPEALREGKVVPMNGKPIEQHIVVLD